MDYPKLRSVEVIPAKDELVCLRDPLGFSDKLVFLPPEVLFIVSLFDGRHSILDIQTEYTRRFGDLLFSDRVRQIIDQLDSCLLLENQRFAEVRDRIVAEFKASPARPASHAGSAYEQEPEALCRQLEALFTAQGGPGLPASRTDPIPSSGKLRGLISPHIDPRRGGACYAASYAELARECAAATFIILGISHQDTRRRFVLTAKDFQSPLGSVPVDRELVEGLKGRCATDFFEDEFVHRGEHSIEFQALFLRFLYPQRQIHIVPVLCASLPPEPEEDSEVREFLAALSRALEERGGQCCLIAGVDLSHVGQRFGQQLSLSPKLLREVEDDDRALIQRVLERDARGFIRLIREQRDQRNVCGVPAIYLLLRLLETGSRQSGSSRLLRYGQAPEPSTQSVVTFMGAAFYSSS